MKVNTEIMNKMSRSFGRACLKFKKHSPEILVITGVIGAVASAVMACKATTKLNPVLEEAKEKIDAIHEHVADPEVAENYTEKDTQKAIGIVYAQTGIELVKLYGPAVTLGVASIGCILASNNIIRKRNIALAAAYTTIDNGFKEYRGRVIERFGEELDKELKYNIKTKEIEEVIVKEDGTEETVTKTVQVADPNEYSEYARFFDDGCKGWEKNSEMNLYFLRQTQNWANEVLKTKGHLFLNDVYEMLGIPKTQAGQIVGWIYDDKHPIGDNYVDFGIYDLYNERKRAFVNGYERTILLDFNVDGDILQYI